MLSIEFGGGLRQRAWRNLLRAGAHTINPPPAGCEPPSTISTKFKQAVSIGLHAVIEVEKSDLAIVPFDADVLGVNVLDGAVAGKQPRVGVLHPIAWL